MTTATLPRTRPVTGATPTATVAAPRCGLWIIDPDRANVAFSGKASFVAPRINARFGDVAGEVDVVDGPAGLTGALEVSVDVTSLATGNPVWDDLIRAVDPFDAEHFPAAVYRSTEVRWAADGQAVIDGALTLRGVTRSVSLTSSYVVGRGGDRMLVRAAGSIDRSTFGVGLDVPGMGKLIPRVMSLDIDVDVVRMI